MWRDRGTRRSCVHGEAPARRNETCGMSLGSRACLASVQGSGFRARGVCVCERCVRVRARNMATQVHDVLVQARARTWLHGIPTVAARLSGLQIPVSRSTAQRTCKAMRLLETTSMARRTVHM